jgi:hypothetical protein
MLRLLQYRYDLENVSEINWAGEVSRPFNAVDLRIGIGYNQT